MKLLPSTIMDMIFTYCSTKEMLLTIEHVCSFWLSVSLSKTSSCWNHINISGRIGIYKVDELIDLLNPRIYRRQITSLSMKHLFSFDNISSFTKLRVLSIGMYIDLLEDNNITNSIAELSLLTLLTSLTLLFKRQIDKHWVNEHSMQFPIIFPRIPELRDLIIVEDAGDDIYLTINGDASPLLRSIRCKSNYSGSTILVNFVGNVSNLEVCHIPEIWICNHNWLVTASSLRSLCIVHMNLEIIFHPNVISRLQIFHVSYGFHLTKNIDLFKLTNLSHLTLPPSCSIDELCKIKTKLPLLSSIHIMIPNQKSLSKSKSLPWLFYINGVDKDVYFRKLSERISLLLDESFLYSFYTNLQTPF